MNKKKSQNYVNARLRKILESEPPDYPPDREPGYIKMMINGVETTVLLEPARNITQWHVTINGERLPKPLSMSNVYKELARRNPPARGW